MSFNFVFPDFVEWRNFVKIIFLETFIEHWSLLREIRIVVGHAANILNGLQIDRKRSKKTKHSLPHMFEEHTMK
jgi:hypothetical protein